jgi:hypothetical protein
MKLQRNVPKSKLPFGARILIGCLILIVLSGIFIVFAQSMDQANQRFVESVESSTLNVDEVGDLQHQSPGAIEHGSSGTGNNNDPKKNSTRG